MELMTKQGYKQTEVGLIPKDWDALELNELGATGRPVIKAGPFGSSLKKEFYVSDGYKIYGQEQVIKNDPFYGNYFINQERYRKLKSCKVLPGDILLSLVGTFGKVLVIPEKALKGIINPRLLRISVDKNKFNTKYISYFLRSTKAIGILESKLQGGTMGVLNASILKSFQIPIPPTLSEQKAIATALSDVDALISSLEQGITKKEAIKQGVMQQLLTGKVRLIGFEGSGKFKQTEVGLIPDDWVVKELGQVLKFGSGQDYKHLSKGDIPVYGTGGIMTFVDSHLYNGDSVGIGRKGTIDKPIFLSGKFWTVDTLFYSHTFVDSTPKFIYYKFLMIPWKEYNEASGVPSLNKNTLGKIKVSIPPTLIEQKAIVQVLSDMDTEIEELESKKVKYQAIKKGMMQELLTGKTRLI